MRFLSDAFFGISFFGASQNLFGIGEALVLHIQLAQSDVKIDFLGIGLQEPVQNFGAFSLAFPRLSEPAHTRCPSGDWQDLSHTVLFPDGSALSNWRLMRYACRSSEFALGSVFGHFPVHSDGFFALPRLPVIGGQALLKQQAVGLWFLGACRYLFAGGARIHQWLPCDSRFPRKLSRDRTALPC